MKNIKLILVVFSIVMLFSLLAGCGAVEQRLADGTAAAAGRSAGSPFSQGDDSGGGDDAAEDAPTTTMGAAEDGSGGGEPTNTLDPIILGTSIQQTVDAINSLTPEPSATNTLEAVEPDDATPTVSGAQFTALAQTLTAVANATETLEATETPEGEATDTPEGAGETQETAEQTPESTAVPCNAFRFVAHVSYPPYSSVNASTSFYKSWQIQNVGSCTWSGDYALVYHSGYQLGGTSPLVLGSGVVVYPGQYVTVTIQLFTPPQPGTYDSQWWMQDASGNTFGGGANFTQPLSAIVVVPGEPDPVFTSPASTAPPFYTVTPTP